MLGRLKRLFSCVIVVIVQKPTNYWVPPIILSSLRPSVTAKAVMREIHHIEMLLSHGKVLRIFLGI